MNDTIAKFCKVYKDKKKNDAELAKRKPTRNIWEIHNDCLDRIVFKVHIYKSAPGYRYIMPSGMYYSGEQSIVLDQEDLDYLYNKYKVKLENEMNKRINKIKEGYNG